MSSVNQTDRYVCDCHLVIDVELEVLHFEGPVVDHTGKKLGSNRDLNGQSGLARCLAYIASLLLTHPDPVVAP